MAPAITKQPEAITVTVGQTASFTVEATGTSPIFQWKKGGSDIPGANSSTYTTPATSLADSGTKYSVVVSNDLGTATSNDASLTVTAKPAITTQPVSQAVAAGQTASFSVVAAGTPPPTYQWKRKNASDIEFTNIAGATSSTYTLTTSSGDNGAKFLVVVTNSAGTVTSNEAVLSDVVITTQPVSQSVASGLTANFSVVATGTGALTYQWKKNGSDIAGATSSTYTPTSSSALNGAKFSVVVSSSAGSVTSNEAVLSDVAISVQPTAQSVVATATASFSVTAAGTGTLTYQWKKGGANIAGATSSTYTTPATVIGDDGAVFTVEVSNGVGPAVTSSSATLTVNRYSLVANASGGTYAKTECVKDNITGLIWEGKTASGSRLGTSAYTNYDGDGLGQKSGGGNASSAEIGASTNSIGYRDSVRTSNLCGYNDWRLPTKEELAGIVASSGSPKIDTTWFPNTQSWYYWSSSPDVSDAYSAWVVAFYNNNVYGSGYRYGTTIHVRLVR